SSHFAYRLLSLIRRPPESPPFPYTTLFRSGLSPHSPRRARRSPTLPGRGIRRMTDAECLEAVRRLLHLVDSYGLAELVVEEGGQIGRAHSELQSPDHLVCRLLLEKKKHIEL